VPTAPAGTTGTGADPAAAAADDIHAQVEAQIAEVERQIDAQFNATGLQMQGPEALAGIDTSAADPTAGDPSGMQYCDRFPAPGANVIIQFGPERVTVTTDANGAFAVSEGPALARLVATGAGGTVEATLQGAVARLELGSTGLNEAAALALLDAMVDPTLADLTEFLTDWAETPAAELALTRHRAVACGTLRSEWNTALRSADLSRVTAVRDRYGADYRAMYCETCAAECRALETADDLVAELGAGR
jgi:hypothetical protein